MQLAIHLRGPYSFASLDYSRFADMYKPNHTTIMIFFQGYHRLKTQFFLDVFGEKLLFFYFQLYIFIGKICRYMYTYAYHMLFFFFSIGRKMFIFKLHVWKVNFTSSRLFCLLFSWPQCQSMLFFILDLTINKKDGLWLPFSLFHFVLYQNPLNII